MGAFASSVGQHVQFLGDIFIHLIQMVVGLIIFCTVTRGIASVRDLGKVGRIAIRSLVYFEVITTIALVIGLVVVNVLKPGSGTHIDPSSLHADPAATAPAKSEGFDDFLVGLVPTSAVQAFAESSILQILVFSVLFACGLASVGEKAQPVLDMVATVQQALFWIIRKVMRIAPAAAFGAIGYTVSEYGLGTLLSLGRLVAVFYLIVLLFFVLVLWPVSRYAGVSLLKLPHRRCRHNAADATQNVTYTYDDGKAATGGAFVQPHAMTSIVTRRPPASSAMLQPAAASWRPWDAQGHMPSTTSPHHAIPHKCRLAGRQFMGTNAPVPL